MRLRHALLGASISLALSIGTAPPAVAQSFFQKLFGFGGGGTAAPVARSAPRSIPSYRFQDGPERRYQSRPQENQDDDIGPPDSGGPYRTMCVRACDGYYFPLRHNAWRRNFAPDAKSCRSACGDQARLFYYSLNGGSVDTMTDLAGRPYKELPHAFGYRKALVSGCTCKAVPWSYEEAARHRQYAEADEAAARLAAEGFDHVTRNFALSGIEMGTAAGNGLSAPAAVAQMEAPKVADVHEPQDVRGLQTSAFSPIEPVPAAVASEAQYDEKPLRRRAKARVTRARFSPSAKQNGGSGLFGPSKSKYVWPGDAR